MDLGSETGILAQTLTSSVSKKEKKCELLFLIRKTGCVPHNIVMSMKLDNIHEGHL